MTFLLSRTKQLGTQTSTGVITLGSQFDDYQSIEEGIVDAKGSVGAEGEQFEAIVMYANQDYSTSWSRCIFQLDTGTLIRQSTERTKVQGSSATNTDVEFDSAQSLVIYGTMSSLASDAVLLAARTTAVENRATAVEFRATTLEDTVAVEAWNEVGAAGQPTFQNSWVNFAASTSSLAFRKIGNVVFIKGLLKSGTSTIFTLPAGYRPPQFANLPVVDNDGGALLNITPAGVVSISNGTAGATLFVTVEASYSV
jgi:hypothetical protein